MKLTYGRTNKRWIAEYRTSSQFKLSLVGGVDFMDAEWKWLAGLHMRSVSVMCQEHLLVRIRANLGRSTSW